MKYTDGKTGSALGLLRVPVHMGSDEDIYDAVDRARDWFKSHGLVYVRRSQVFRDKKRQNERWFYVFGREQRL